MDEEINRSTDVIHSAEIKPWCHDNSVGLDRHPDMCTSGRNKAYRRETNVATLLLLAIQQFVITRDVVIAPFFD